MDCCPHIYRPSPALNTCGLCGLKKSSPFGLFKSKPVQTGEKIKELKHDSPLLPLPWGLGILPFTQGYCVSLCVMALRPCSHSPLHSLTINTSSWCLRLTDSSCEFSWESVTEVLIQSVFHFLLATSVRFADIVVWRGLLKTFPLEN